MVDVTQEDALAQVAKAIGKWDVLVLGAGYVSSPSTIAASDFKEFWQSFEVILLCSFLLSPLWLNTDYFLFPSSQIRLTQRELMHRFMLSCPQPTLPKRRLWR